MAAVLDLRFHGSLPSSLCAEFEEVAYSCRGPFNDMVTRLSAPNMSNLDWWVQGPASRNTFASPFFHHFCCLNFVQHLMAKRRFNFDVVVVDSPGVKKAIESILRSTAKLNCVVRFPRGSYAVLRFLRTSYAALLFFFLRRLFQYVAARTTRGLSRARVTSGPLTLIDTFATAAHVSDDRWYGALWTSLSERQRAQTYFVPSVVNTPLRFMRRAYTELREGSRNVLVKDDFLSVTDIIRAFLYRARRYKISLPPVCVCGSDIALLAREELVGNRDIPTVVDSLLTYRFIERLNQNGVRVKLAIDWFEGQVIDKAWNLGFKHHYPDARRIGYRAFESFPFYLCSYPIPVEIDAGVVPDVFAVQGRGTIPTVREFVPDLDVIVIPSFKSQHVWDDGHEPGARDCGETFVALVALPISEYAAARIVERLFEALVGVRVEGRDVRYIVKPHPTVDARRVLDRISRPLPAEVIFSSEQSFGRLLRQSDLLITEASSTCLEALAVGLPVIIMANETGLTYDPVPAAIPRFVCRKARTRNELIEAIASFAARSAHEIEEQRAIGNRIRADYFEPVTDEGVARLMNEPRYVPAAPRGESEISHP